MIRLITGGSASGKSEYAEQQALSWGPARRIYIATMIPGDDETRARIARHRRMRADKKFETVECFTGLDRLEFPGGTKAEETVLLLECMSNLTANEQYLSGGSIEEIRKRIGDGIRNLQKLSRRIIIVTNEIFSDGGGYARETEEYLRLLGLVNQDLAELSEEVTEVVYGIPVPVKHFRFL